MATCAVDTPADYDDEQPNHMIFWLDAVIGDPTKYINLKKAFSSNTDPRAQTWTMLNDQDVDRLFRTGEDMVVKFEGVNFHLQAFQNEEDCLEAFEQNQDKRIFFITSGSLAREVVPKIIERFRSVFTDPITNRGYPSIYIFCENIAWEMDWIKEDDLEYLQMFDFDSELLERLTRDIAEYFVERGRRLRQDNDFMRATQSLYWARRLWHGYDQMLQQISTYNPREVVLSQRAKEIDELIGEVEQLCADQQRTEREEKSNYYQLYSDEKGSDDDTKSAEPCG